MIRGNNHITTARMAICAALLCGSSAALAQATEVAPSVAPAPPPVAAPVASQPAPQPVAPTGISAPPAVRTIPDEQLNQPVVAAEPERAAPRRSAARAAPARTEAAPVAAVPVASEPTPAEPVDALPLPIDEGSPVTATVEDSAAIGPVEQAEPAEMVDGSDDWMVYGGIAAALGLAGVGAALARRRRRPQAKYVAVERMEPVTPTKPAAPIAAAPVAFAEPARVEPTAPVIAARAEPRYVPTVADRDLPPVTDPLFAHQAELKPITDPMFSQKIDVPPVTDPMFADHDDYAGKGSAGSAFDKRRTWPAAPARELEPAE